MRLPLFALVRARRSPYFRNDGARYGRFFARRGTFFFRVMRHAPPRPTAGLTRRILEATPRGQTHPPDPSYSDSRDPPGPPTAVPARERFGWRQGSPVARSETR